jgi:hypothetical protein
MACASGSEEDLHTTSTAVCDGGIGGKDGLMGRASTCACTLNGCSLARHCIAAGTGGCRSLGLCWLPACRAVCVCCCRVHGCSAQSFMLRHCLAVLAVRLLVLMAILVCTLCVCQLSWARRAEGSGGGSWRNFVLSAAISGCCCCPQEDALGALDAPASQSTGDCRLRGQLRVPATCHIPQTVWGRPVWPVARAWVFARLGLVVMEPSLYAP